MKEIIVTGCLNCPFLITDIDYDKVGYDTVVYCHLQRYLGFSYECIAAFDSNLKLLEECDNCKNEEYDGIYECTCKYEEQEDLITPLNCPLKNNELNIKFDENRNN